MVAHLSGGEECEPYLQFSARARVALGGRCGLGERVQHGGGRLQHLSSRLLTTNKPVKLSIHRKGKQKKRINGASRTLRWRNGGFLFLADG